MLVREFGIVRADARRFCPSGYVAMPSSDETPLYDIEGCFDNRDIIEIYVNAVFRDGEHLQRISNLLLERGIDHIKFSYCEPESPIRTRTFLLDNRGRVYFVRFNLQQSGSGRARALQHLMRHIIQPLEEWTLTNAVGDVVLDERGIVLEKEEDAVLFTLKFGIRYRPLNMACANTSTL